MHCAFGQSNATPRGAMFMSQKYYPAQAEKSGQADPKNAALPRFLKNMLGMRLI